MTVPAALSLEPGHPMMSSRWSWPRTPAPADPDAALVNLCTRLRDDADGHRRFHVVAPQDWEHFDRERAMLQEVIGRMADTPAVGRSGLRAKALALWELLDDGTGKLYEDAALPDRLAWSLLKDILAA